MAVKKNYLDTDVVNAYEKGATAKEVAAIFNLSETSVFRVLDVNNVVRRTYTKAFTVDEESEIKKLYISGTSLTNIGKLFNVSKPTIKKVLLKNAVQIKSSKEYKKNWTELQLSAIAKDFKDGIPTHTICLNHKISPSNLRYQIKKQGLSARNHSEAARQYRLNENYFSEIDSRDKAYILGLIYADGCNTRHSIVITLHKNDIKLLEQIRDLVFLDPIPIKVKKDNCATLYIHNKQIKEDLEYKWGVIPNKSLQTVFPNNLNSKYYADFIRGYFDGDGSITTWVNAKNYFLCNFEVLGTLEFLEKIQEILIENLNLSKTKIYNTASKVKVLKYGGRINVTKIRDFLYCNLDKNSLFLDRKHAKLFKIEYSIYGKN